MMYSIPDPALTRANVSAAVSAAKRVAVVGGAAAGRMMKDVAVEARGTAEALKAKAAVGAINAGRAVGAAAGAAKGRYEQLGPSEYERMLQKDQNIDVDEYARKQLGFLGQPLLIKEGILKPIRVAHMNSANVGYQRAAPMINAKGAPMADFIYRDIVSRATEVLHRYLCGEDELLENESQLSRKILTHLKKYHSLLRETTKEAKRALNSKRVSAKKDLVNSKYGQYEKRVELEAKQRDLESKISALERGIRETAPTNRTSLALTRKRAMKEMELKYVISLLKHKPNAIGNDDGCPDPNMQRVFKTTGGELEGYACLDAKYLSPLYNPNQNQKPNVDMYNTGALQSAGRVPFRTLYGDRLVKKRLVYHSFIERLNSALYPNYTRNTVQVLAQHPLRKRFSGLFQGNKDPMLSSAELKWVPGLRSFGAKGPQSYWIQLVREMYDTRRVEHIRKLTRKSRVNKSQTPVQIRKHFEEVNDKLGGNLGVTCYGYSCAEPSRPQDKWHKSYHRFGRAWYCMDVSPNDYQLPFGCYNDKCAPPTKSLQRMNYFRSVNSDMPDESSRPRDDLAQIAVNQICTTLLQKDSKVGSQARYGHIRTALNTVPLGRLSPADAFAQLKSVRSWTDRAVETTIAIVTDVDNVRNRNGNNSGNNNNGNNNGNTSTKIAPDRIGTQSAELKVHILHARKAIKLLPGYEVPTNGNVLINSSLSNIRNVLTNSKKNGKRTTYNYTMISKNDKRKSFRARQENLYVNEYEAPVNNKITYYNIKKERLNQAGGGLRKGTADERKRDARVLDNNFLMVDGDISTGYNPSMRVLAYGGSERVLGIARKKVGKYLVKPLILPLSTDSPRYKDVRENMSINFENMYNDATTGVKGLVDRQMQYVCEPLFQTGSLMKGTHFNDLMRRFLSLVGTPVHGRNLENRLQSPVLLDIMKCLQFYLYVHVGLSAEQALKAIKYQQGRRMAYQMQTDMYSLAQKLRLLGNTGPMPSDQFKKIVRQYLLTEGRGTMNRSNVDKEIAQMEQELKTFKIFGMRFARNKLLPGFLTPQPRTKMGIPGKAPPFLNTGTRYQAIQRAASNPITNATRRFNVEKRKMKARQNRNAERKQAFGGAEATRSVSTPQTKKIAPL